MGQNVSRPKAERIERAQRVEALTPYVVPGWRVDPVAGKIVAVDTVLGAYQRRQSVLLRCERADCRRRVDIDFKAAVRGGLGDRRVAELHRLLTCGHWQGCALRQVSADYPHGVPLVAYLEHEDVLISIACSHCRTRSLLSPQAVIDRLRTKSIGDGSTGVIELGSVVRGPCRKCGQRAFKTDVVWPDGPWSTRS